MATKKPTEVAKATYSDVRATALTSSKLVDSLDKTITKFELPDGTIVPVWSFAGEHHDVGRGERCLLRRKSSPDGVFYNLED